MSVRFTFLVSAADQLLRLPTELHADAEEMLDHLRARVQGDLRVEGFGVYRGRVRILFAVVQGEVIVLEVLEA